MEGIVQTTKELSDFSQKLLTKLKDIADEKDTAGKELLEKKENARKRYEKRIAAIEADKEKRIVDANRFVQNDRAENDRGLKTLDLFISSMPDKYRKMYSSTDFSSIPPKKPDLAAMHKAADSIINGKLFGSSKVAATLFEEIAAGRKYFIARSDESDTLASEEIADAIADAKEETGSERSDHDDNVKKSEADHETKVNTLEKKLHSIIDDNLVSNFDNTIAVLYRSLGGSEGGKFSKSIIQHLLGDDDQGSAWSSFSPGDERPAEVMIGFIKHPFDVPKEFHVLLKERMPFAYSSGDGIRIPYAESISSPFLLKIDYEETEKKTVAEGLQSTILKLFRSMPVSTYNITYIDTTDRGSGLGKLMDLADIKGTKVLKVCTSKDDASNASKDMLTFIDRTNRTLAGASIEEYNASRDVASAIPQQFVIINDFSLAFSNDWDNSMSTLIQNAKKVGMSVILTSDVNLNASEKIGLSGFTNIKISSKGSTLENGTFEGEFTFDEVSKEQLEFIGMVKSAYEGAKVDNSFLSLFKNRCPDYRNADSGITIPFALNSRNKLTDLKLVSPEGAHTLLSGTTGSGKSVALHMIITSVIMNYSPDDVELWLVDFKTAEFAEYIDNVPPHVKLICVEIGEEATFGILDMANAEYTKRINRFKEVGVSNIKDHNQKHPEARMPRILLIVDEFHRMTQAIQDNENYVRMLENIMTEARATGISCVFSDQAVSAGLRGFTNKGRMQLGNRLAMRNTDSEIRETLDADRSAYDEETRQEISNMTVGQVATLPRIMSDMDEKRGLGIYKAVLTNKGDRMSVIAEAKKRVGEKYTKDPIIINGTKQQPLKSKTKIIIDKEGAEFREGAVSVHVGTPSGLSPYFSFELKRKTESNLMVIGQNDELRASIVLHTILSFKRRPDSRIYVVTDKYDNIYEDYREHFDALSKRGVVIVDTLEGLCTITRELQNRVAMRDETNCDMVCWLGLEEYVEDLFDLPDGGDEHDDFLNSLNGDADNAEDSLYNASQDIANIIRKGPKRGLFSLVSFPTVNAMKSVKFVNLNDFSRRVALKMDNDGAQDLFGNRNATELIKSSDEMTAVYQESGTDLAAFRPYLLIDAEEWVKQWE
jgi:DNA segregation ATPase FtsK/SpoIIIE and related proteins